MRVKLCDLSPSVVGPLTAGRWPPLRHALVCLHVRECFCVCCVRACVCTCSCFFRTHLRVCMLGCVNEHIVGIAHGAPSSTIWVGLSPLHTPVHTKQSSCAHSAPVSDTDSKAEYG